MGGQRRQRWSLLSLLSLPPLLALSQRGSSGRTRPPWWSSGREREREVGAASRRRSGERRGRQLPRLSLRLRLLVPLLLLEELSSAAAFAIARGGRRLLRSCRWRQKELHGWRWREKQQQQRKWKLLLRGLVAVLPFLLLLLLSGLPRQRRRSPLRPLPSPRQPRPSPSPSRPPLPLPLLCRRLRSPRRLSPAAAAAAGSSSSSPPPRRSPPPSASPSAARARPSGAPGSRSSGTRGAWRRRREGG